MKNTLVVASNLTVEIDQIIQVYAPGLFDDCPEQESVDSRIRGFSGICKKQYNIRDIHTINFPLPKGKHMVACLLHLSDFSSATRDDGYIYKLDILWFQKDYLFPIDPFIEKELSRLPFRELACKYKFPF